jgi:ABC-2 type transport system permease protein
VAGYNPVTYVLEALRSLITEGWEWGTMGKGVLAICAVGVLSMSMCFAALRGRLKNG